MSRATLTSKGQITLPVAIREQYKLENGDMLQFIPAGDEELRVRVVRRHPAAELAGLLGGGKPYLGSPEAEREAAAKARSR
jgi:antitoxin PrlF